MTARVLAATALALALSAAPAAAATLAPLKPCYVAAGEAPLQLENVVVRGEGFAPNRHVEVLIDGRLILTTATGTIGEFSGEIDVPYQANGERPFTLTVRDPLGNTATQQSRVTSLGASLRPREAPPSRRVRFNGRGFTADAPVFAHYVFRDRVRKTVRLTREASACGAFKVRRRQIPVPQPKVGDWTLQIDQQRRYSAEPESNWVRLLIRVRRVFLDPGS
jgi:hypothetical protein